MSGRCTRKARPVSHPAGWFNSPGFIRTLLPPPLSSSQPGGPGCRAASPPTSALDYLRQISSLDFLNKTRTPLALLVLNNSPGVNTTRHRTINQAFPGAAWQGARGARQTPELRREQFLVPGGERTYTGSDKRARGALMGQAFPRRLMRLRGERRCRGCWRLG